MNNSFTSVKILNLILLSGFFAGCSALNGMFLGKSPAVTFERVTSEEDTLQQIQATPTRFTLPIEDNQAAWERGRFFLSTYAGEGKTTQDRDSMIREGRTGFRYQFTRQFDKGGAHFQVFCTPVRGSSHSTAEALLNAKNVARFLKDGELEISQLIVE